MGGKLKLLLILAFLLMSCSQKFTNSHKLYGSVPAKNASVGFVQLGEAFMLTRAEWFAEKLSIQGDSIYDKLEVLTDFIIFGEIQNNWNASIVSKNERENFSKETLKMDKTIFIKTRFPEQGVEIRNDSANVPDYLFIIHEYTVGGDLEAENFYDYTKANVEMSQKKKIKNLSIIATFTLWDNKRQIPLRSGIVNAQTPIKEDFIDRNLFIEATRKTVAECLKKL